MRCRWPVEFPTNQTIKFMPRISVKKEKAPRKSAKAAAENLPAETPAENPLPVAAPVEQNDAPPRTVDSVKAAAQADAQKDVSNNPVAESSSELRPPSVPVEPTTSEDTRFIERRGYQRDKIAASMNIAKLQAMQMTELNAMAREYGVENFGTMRKHEVIFHILSKNAARAGVLFSEGVIEVLPEGFGFLRSRSFNYLPCPEDIYVSPSQIRRLICRRAI